MAETNKIKSSLPPGLAGLNKDYRYNPEGVKNAPSFNLEKCDEMIDLYNSCIGNIKPKEVPENIPGMYAITKHNFSLYESILKRVPQGFIKPIIYQRAGGSCEFVNIINDGHFFKLVTDRLRESEYSDSYFTTEDKEEELRQIRKKSNTVTSDMREHISEIHKLIARDVGSMFDVWIEPNAVMFGYKDVQYSLSFNCVAERVFCGYVPVIKNRDGTIVEDYKLPDRTTDFIRRRLDSIHQIEIDKKCSLAAIDRVEQEMRQSTRINYNNIDHDKIRRSYSRNDIKTVRFFHVSLDYLINPLNTKLEVSDDC